MFNQDFDSINYWENLNQPAFDPAATRKQLYRLRNKVASSIREHMKNQDMTTTETASATKMARCCIAQIAKGDLQKISMDRLLKVALRLGLQIKISVNSI